MYCPKCGKLNKDEVKFCAFCGAGIKEEEITKSFPTKITEPTKRKKIFLGVGLAILLILIIVLSFGVNLPGGRIREKSPSATVKEFFRAVEEGEYSKLKSYVSSHLLLSEPLLIEEFIEVQREIKNMGGIKKIDITKENIEGETAEVCYKIELGNGETEEECGYLIREEGIWKIGK